MNYKPLLLSFLLFTPTPTLSLNHHEELELKQQKEKDDQEYRLNVLKLLSVLGIAVIGAVVKIYLHDKQS